MKIWLWILGIALFIASVVIGALQHSEVQQLIGKYYCSKGKYEKSFNWYYSSAINDNEWSKLFCMHVDPVFILEEHELLQVIDWKISHIIDTPFQEALKKAKFEIEDYRALLSLKYYRGDGVDRNIEKSYYWARVSYIFGEEQYPHGNPWMKEFSKILKKELTIKQISKNNEMAIIVANKSLDYINRNSIAQ